MKILVAMSGGVDSAVAALLLARSGVQVVGAYMKNWINEDGIAGDCPWRQDIEDARAAAEAIGIEFRVVNLMREYRARVVDHLLGGYDRGETPNPDVLCNREIKFGVLRDHARREGFDALATGHYAIRREAPGGGFALHEGADSAKDQSYFLALLTPAQIVAARFPIGHLRKPEVRALAAAARLPNAAKKDSQGICFIGRVRMHDFLRQYLPDKPGEIVRATDGAVLGTHRGLHLYTIGQRRGIGVPSNTDHENFVVVGRDMAANRLLVAFEGADAPGLWSREVVVAGVSHAGAPIDARRELLARVRYRDPKIPALFEPLDGGRARVVFAEPQRALAVGQVLALYDGTRVLGGAVFAEVRPIVAAPQDALATRPGPGTNTPSMSTSLGCSGTPDSARLI